MQQDTKRDRFYETEVESHRKKYDEIKIVCIKKGWNKELIQER